MTFSDLERRDTRAQFLNTFIRHVGQNKMQYKTWKDTAFLKSNISKNGAF